MSSPQKCPRAQPMNRVKVIQKIINKTGAQNYLEIGVSRGDCFLSIKARRKVAVDPKFNLPAKRSWKMKWDNRNSQYYEMPSDDFFSKIKLPHGFDVTFIDGLHTYQQSLKDFENAFAVLGENGVILMHDCNPLDAATAYPAESHSHAASLKLPGWNGGWMGDVWKTIVHLRSQRRDLKAFVLDCDFGIGIITRGQPAEVLDISPVELQKMDYKELEKNRRQWLDLKSEGYFKEFLRTL
jgi:hypothetical protein